MRERRPSQGLEDAKGKDCEKRVLRTSEAGGKPRKYQAKEEASKERPRRLVVKPKSFLPMLPGA